jgi:hypothetical protein
MSISLVNVAKYYKGLPHQDEALRQLQKQIQEVLPEILDEESEFAKAWRINPRNLRSRRQRLNFDPLPVQDFGYHKTRNSDRTRVWEFSRNPSPKLAPYLVQIPPPTSIQMAASISTFPISVNWITWKTRAVLAMSPA